jgi:hypothetical protein
MKKLITFISIFAFILQITPFIGAQNNDKLPTWAYQEFKLPNGLRVCCGRKDYLHSWGISREIVKHKIL